MKLFWDVTGRGDLQFIIHAETREERVVLKQFRDQVERARFFIHGWTYEAGAFGPSSFNFGSVPSEANPSDA